MVVLTLGLSGHFGGAIELMDFEVLQALGAVVFGHMGFVVLQALGTVLFGLVGSAVLHALVTVLSGLLDLDLVYGLVTLHSGVVGLGVVPVLGGQLPSSSSSPKHFLDTFGL